MTRLLVCTFVCLLFASPAHAQDNPLSAMWPFGKKKAATRSYDNVNPFAKTKKTSDKTFGLPSPTKLIDRAEKSTGSMFQKTRESLKGVQDFGKSLNPFASKGKSKPKKSLLDTFFPKQPVDSTPATMNDFMNLKRPKY